MRRSLSAFAGLLVLSGGAVAEPFTWDPNAVRLDGRRFTADKLILSDFAKITFGSGGTTFVDTGILPVIGFTLNGATVSPVGYGTPDGSGWGTYIRYSGSGTQEVSPQGFPLTATFDQLSYELFGYNGNATFGFAPDGNAVVGGAISQVTLLERGSLITGSLAFVPGPLGPTIIGDVEASIDEVRPQFVQSNPSQFDVQFVHPLGEYVFTSPTTLQIAGGTSSTATLVTRNNRADQSTLFAKTELSDNEAVEVPEPATLVVLTLGLLGLAAARPRARQA